MVFYLFLRVLKVVWILYFPLNPPAVVLQPAFGKSWHISPQACQALTSLIWRQEPIHLSPFSHFQESPRKGRTNSTTCIIRNQPGLRENTLTTINRESGIPRPSLSFMPRQPRGKNAGRIKAKRLKTRLNWNFQANRRCWDLYFSAEPHGVRSVPFISILWSKIRLL